MKFYDRELETENLRRIEKLSSMHAQMTVITGRRRIGKTSLIKHALRNIPTVYFFVSKKSETLHCKELTEIINSVLNEPLGEFSSMAKLFEALMIISKRKNFTLIFDEFQNYAYVNPTLFSEFQNIWDTHKDESKINLVFCGSIFSLMNKIFADNKEPLYGRATNRITVRPFSIQTLKNIIVDHNPDYKPDDILAFYTITGGVAKYVEQLADNSAFTLESIFKTVFSFGSYFINEGKDLLTDEFSKDYGKYFSVLEAIANGNTTRAQINNYVEFECGGYLDKLENNYNIIAKMRPLGFDTNSKNVKYSLADNFLNFWFRFVYRYRSAVEINNFDFLIQKLKQDYNTYSGQMLERLFRQKYLESGAYNIVTNFWTKNGENEIDLVAVNELDKQCLIAEIKRDPQRANIMLLKQKSESLPPKYRKMHKDFLILGLEDI